MYKHFFKRVFDFFISLVAIIVLSPIFIIVTIGLHFANKGAGAFFTQVRPGYHGKPFKVIKYKSMTDERDENGELLPDAQRLTKVGRLVRSTSLDELPQLFNVLTGDMSLVGPRPEVRKYVDLYTEEQKKVLSVRPGITDYASIEYVDENVILGASEDPDKTYIEEIMPDKIRYNMKYINNQSVGEYFKVIFLTIMSIVGR